MPDPRVVRFLEIRARIEEGPVAYCNPEVAYADALWLMGMLDSANATVVALDEMRKSDHA